MNRLLSVGLLLTISGFCHWLTAQEPQRKKSEEQFVLDAPTVGDMLPDVTVFASDGTAIRTSDLRGHYTVLTFGCLT